MIGPHSTIIDSGIGKGLPGDSVLSEPLRTGGGLLGRSLRPPPPRGEARGRSRRQAPSSRSRTRRSARTRRSRICPTSVTPRSVKTRIRGRHDHRQLRRRREAPHEDRLRREDRRRHDAGGAGEVGDGAYTGAGAVIRDNIPPGPLSVSENDRETLMIRRAARRPQGRRGKQSVTITESSAQTTIPHDYSKRAMVFAAGAPRTWPRRSPASLERSVGDVTP